VEAAIRGYPLLHGTAAAMKRLQPRRPLKKNGYSEIEWVQDPFTRLNPHHVGAIYLEPFDGTPSSKGPDSGGSDHDVIPIAITQGSTFTYSLDPSDTTTTIKKAVMRDSRGSTVFTLDRQAPGITMYLAPGIYDLLIYSGFSVSENNEDHRLVFLHSGQAEYGSAKSNPSDVNQLLSTKSCPYGDLSGADLNYADLPNAGLHYADLSYASLYHANLSNASLNRVILHSTIMPDGSTNHSGTNHPGHWPF